MDLISGLKSEFFRPLVTLIVPGAISVAPLVLLAQERIAAIGPFWKDHPAAFTAILLTTIVAAGLVLENVGSRIEESIWDAMLKRKNKTFDEEWHEYLQLNTRDEIVAQRYLRSMLTRMKFELAAAPAFMLHAIGLHAANRRLEFLTRSELWSITVVLVLLSGFLLWESYDGAYTLSRLRRDVIAGVNANRRAA